MAKAKEFPKEYRVGGQMSTSKFRYLLVDEDLQVYGCNNEAHIKTILSWGNLLVVELQNGVSSWGGENIEFSPIKEVKPSDFSSDTEDDK